MRQMRSRGRDVGYAWLPHQGGEGRHDDVGTDRVTKVLLGMIAAGIWALVLLQVSAGGTMKEIGAEVKAIGMDTQSIHEDLDAPDQDVESGATSLRRD